MPSDLQSFALGAVQGLTEFLPVSSSAHLVLLPWLLRWQDPGLAFDVALHMGTLLALFIYYRREWLQMGRSLVSREATVSRRLLLLVLTATVPGALVGLAFEKQAATVFRSPLLIAVTMAGLGLGLWLSDRMGSQEETMADMTFARAFLIGLSQALAIIPGVSRSGATITVARVVGMRREDAANFSFLMATPIIAGAGLLEARKLVHSGLHQQSLLGFTAALAFGLIAIAGLIRFVRTRSYRPFAWYRLAVAGVVVAVWWLRL